MRRPSRSRVAVATGLSLGAAAVGVLLAPAASAAEPLSMTVSTGAHEGGSLTVQGTGCLPTDATDEVYVLTALDVDPVTDEANPDDVLDGVLADDGTWSVTYDFGPGTAGDHTVDAVCLHYAGDLAEPYDTVPFTVAAATTSTPDTTSTPTHTSSPAPAPVVDPVTQPSTAGTAEKSGSTTGAVTPGARIVKVIAGFRPNEVVTLTLHSDPVVLGTFTADAKGVVTASFTLPAGTPVGDHHLVFEGNMGTHFVAPLTVAAAAGTSSATSGLAYTGADVAVPLVGGLVLVAVGAGAVVAGRRRKTEPSQV